MTAILNKIGWLFIAVFYRLVGLIWNLILKKTFGSRRNEIPAIDNFLLLEPATVLAAKIRTRQVKSEDVVQAYISRIKQVNPIVNALVDQRFDEALKEAQKADSYVDTSGKSQEQLEMETPFLGVPFTTKNAIGIEGLIMDAGIIVRKGYKTIEDSVAVALLKKAGAIPLGVTNVPEACMWNDASCKLYGRTNNPYDLTKIPGGSSGGESALISSAAIIFGLGNDIGGSIRIPAYSCGIFGHKPTRKIVSNQGQFPSSYRTDLDKYNCTGPLCRYAMDLRPSLKILAAANASKLKLDTEVDFRNIKIFYTDHYPDGILNTRITTTMKESVLKVVKYFEKNHGVKAERIKFPISPSLFTTIWLSKLGSAKATPLESIITDNDKPFNLPLELLKWCFRQCSHTLNMLWYILLQTYSSVNHPEVVKQTNQLTEKLDEGLKQILGDNGVLIFPPQPEPAYYHQETIFKFYNVGYTGIFNILGYPVTQCPIGLTKDGFPRGVQVVATNFNDHLTIACAEEIEVGFGGWKSPAPIKEMK